MKTKGFIFLFLFVISFFSFVSAEGDFFGCCAQTLANEPCVVTLPELCTPGRLFAANTQCEQTSFCKTGCCVDDSSGTCDKRVIQSTCKGVWTADKNCNLPQCQLGCCNLENSGIITTEKQCEIYTKSMNLGENIFADWDSSISEAQCVLSSLVEKKGACITSTSEDKKNCKMMTNKECLSATGTLENFVEGKLCTSPELNTVCEKTRETTCVDGKDGVYFKDTCGNPANIYDASRVDDQTYWNDVVAPENSCNAGNGNANSQDCGNCDRFQGGKCSSSIQDKFEVTIGTNYCKQTSCLEDGVLYKNGESWCVYDGAIGNGDDVVGSRHWRHVCNLGTIVSEPCADYRNQICVQTNTITVNGLDTEFRKSACRENIWRECLLDGEEGAEVTDCVIKQINGGGSFDVNFTAPKYSPGFDLSGKDKDAEEICALGNFTCVYVEVADAFGRCKIQDGENCKKPETLEQMNDYCRSLGDCGLKANIVGQLEEGYKVSRGSFSEEYRSNLAVLSIPVVGQFISGNGLSDYLTAIAPYQPGADFGEENMGVYGIIREKPWKYIALAGYAGVYITTWAIMKASGRFGIPVGYVTIMAVEPGTGLILAGLWKAFGSECEVTKVAFTCEPWQPPTGGDDCSKCNNDPLKPCSDYRCQSLGAACQLINKGTKEEMCSAMENDARPPVITIGDSFNGTIFTQIQNGFRVTTSSGDCLNAYETKLLNFTTNKPAQCKFSIDQEAEFDNMSKSFGTAYYTYSHVLPFQFPDPSHGMSRGINWSGQMTLYVLCQDAYANQFRTPYKIETCVYQGKDITPPTIIRTEPTTNSLLSFNTTSVNFIAYSTEPSTCKWSNSDEKFETMTKLMTCEQDILNKGLYGYVCTTNVPINSTQTNIYIACQDQPWLDGIENQFGRNTMTSNINVVLDKVASPIKIDNIAPKEDLETDTSMKTVELGVQTSDGAKWHVCSYSFSGYNTMIPFYTTGERVHKQSFNLPIGTHQIFIECKDETGDSVRGETNFRVLQDTSAPLIARIFKVGSSIKVITTEEAECRYSIDKCGFIFSNGIAIGTGLEHSISSKAGEVYYVKCKDEWGNSPSLCSATINLGSKSISPNDLSLRF